MQNATLKDKTDVAAKELHLKSARFHQKQFDNKAYL
jgi:hypothetical protein